jgi:hypothetical protein
VTRLAELLTGIPSGTPSAPASLVAPVKPAATKRGSGLSTHARSAAPRAQGSDEDAMYNMPLEELRIRAARQLAGE